MAITTRTHHRTLPSREVRARLEAAGWHIARETLAELSDALFGDAVRPDGTGKRRWTPEQVDHLITIGRIRQQAGLTLEEVIEAVSVDDETFAAAQRARIAQVEARNEDLAYLRNLIRRSR